jgi:hypothetical protein
MKTVMTIVAALTLAGPAFAQDEETEIRVDEASDAAIATAQANAQGRTFDGALRQIEDGVEMYEFIGTKDDGLAFAVEVFADGTLWETAEEITMAQVPDVVAAAFATELPDFEPDIIERNTRNGGDVVVYEFEGERDGVVIEAEIHADGSNVAVTEEG